MAVIPRAPSNETRCSQNNIEVSSIPSGIIRRVNEVHADDTTITSMKSRGSSRSRSVKKGAMRSVPSVLSLKKAISDSKHRILTRQNSIDSYISTSSTTVGLNSIQSHNRGSSYIGTVAETALDEKSVTSSHTKSTSSYIGTIAEYSCQRSENGSYIGTIAEESLVEKESKENDSKLSNLPPRTPTRSKSTKVQTSSSSSTVTSTDQSTIAPDKYGTTIESYESFTSVTPSLNLRSQTLLNRSRNYVEMKDKIGCLDSMESCGDDSTVVMENGGEIVSGGERRRSRADSLGSVVTYTTRYGIAVQGSIGSRDSTQNSYIGTVEGTVDSEGRNRQRAITQDSTSSYIGTVAGTVASVKKNACSENGDETKIQKCDSNVSRDATQNSYIGTVEGTVDSEGRNRQRAITQDSTSSYIGTVAGTVASVREVASKSFHGEEKIQKCDSNVSRDATQNSYIGTVEGTVDSEGRNRHRAATQDSTSSYIGTVADTVASVKGDTSKTSSGEDRIQRSNSNVSEDATQSSYIGTVRGTVTSEGKNRHQAATQDSTSSYIGSVASRAGLDSKKSDITTRNNAARSIVGSESCVSKEDVTQPSYIDTVTDASNADERDSTVHKGPDDVEEHAMPFILSSDSTISTKNTCGKKCEVSQYGTVESGAPSISSNKNDGAETSMASSSSTVSADKYGMNLESYESFASHSMNIRSEEILAASRYYVGTKDQCGITTTDSMSEAETVKVLASIIANLDANQNNPDAAESYVSLATIATKDDRYRVAMQGPKSNDNRCTNIDSNLENKMSERIAPEKAPLCSRPADSSSIVRQNSTSSYVGTVVGTDDEAQHASSASIAETTLILSGDASTNVTDCQDGEIVKQNSTCSYVGTVKTSASSYVGTVDGAQHISSTSSASIAETSEGTVKTSASSYVGTVDEAQHASSASIAKTTQILSGDTVKTSASSYIGTVDGAQHVSSASSASIIETSEGTVKTSASSDVGTVDEAQHASSTSIAKTTQILSGDASTNVTDCQDGEISKQNSTNSYVDTVKTSASSYVGTVDGAQHVSSASSASIAETLESRISGKIAPENTSLIRSQSGHWSGIVKQNSTSSYVSTANTSASSYVGTVDGTPHTSRSTPIAKTLEVRVNARIAPENAPRSGRNGSFRETVKQNSTSGFVGTMNSSTNHDQNDSTALTSNEISQEDDISVISQARIISRREYLPDCKNQEPTPYDSTSKSSSHKIAKSFDSECNAMPTTTSSGSSTQLSNDGRLVATDNFGTESNITTTVCNGMVKKTRSLDTGISWQPSDVSSINLNQLSPRKQEMVNKANGYVRASVDHVDRQAINDAVPLLLSSDSTISTKNTRSKMPQNQNGQDVVAKSPSTNSHVGSNETSDNSHMRTVGDARRNDSVSCISQGNISSVSQNCGSSHDDSTKISTNSYVGTNHDSGFDSTVPIAVPETCSGGETEGNMRMNNDMFQKNQVDCTSIISNVSTPVHVNSNSHAQRNQKFFPSYDDGIEDDHSDLVNNTVGEIHVPQTSSMKSERVGDSTTCGSTGSMNSSTISVCETHAKEREMTNSLVNKTATPAKMLGKPPPSPRTILKSSGNTQSTNSTIMTSSSCTASSSIPSSSQSIPNLDQDVKQNDSSSYRDIQEIINESRNHVSNRSYNANIAKSKKSAAIVMSVDNSQNGLQSQKEFIEISNTYNEAVITDRYGTRTPQLYESKINKPSSVDSPKSHASSNPPPLMSTFSATSSKEQWDACENSPSSDKSCIPPPLMSMCSTSSTKKSSDNSPKSHGSSIPPPLMSTCSSASSTKQSITCDNSPSSDRSCIPPPLMSSCSTASTKRLNIVSPSSKDILDDLRSHDVLSNERRKSQEFQRMNSAELRGSASQNDDNMQSSTDAVAQTESHVGSVLDVGIDLGGSNETSLYSKNSFASAMSNGSGGRNEKTDASSVHSPLRHQVIIKQSGSHISTSLADKSCSESGSHVVHAPTSESQISKHQPGSSESSASESVTSPSYAVPSPSSREVPFNECNGSLSSSPETDVVEVQSHHESSNPSELMKHENQLPKPVASPRNLHILNEFKSRVAALSSSNGEKVPSQISPSIKGSSSCISNSLSKTEIASFEGIRYADIGSNDEPNSFDTDEVSTTSEMQLDCKDDEISSTISFKGIVDAADESLLDTELCKRFILAFETTLQNNPSILPGSSNLAKNLELKLKSATDERNEAVYQMKGKIQKAKNEKFDLESRLINLEDALGENRDELMEKLQKEQNDVMHAEHTLHVLTSEVHALKHDAEVKNNEATKEKEELNKHLSHLIAVRAEIKSSLEKEKEILDQERKTFAQINDTRRGIHAQKINNKELESQIEAMTDAIAEEKKSLQAQANDIQSFEAELQQLKVSNEATLKELEDEKKELLEMTLALQKKKETLLVHKIETEAALKREKEDLENQIENSRMMTSRDMKKIVKAKAKSMDIDAMIKSFADAELKKKASRLKQQKVKVKARLLERAKISKNENQHTVDFGSAEVNEDEDANGGHMMLREDPITGEIEIEANVKSLVDAEIEQKMSEIEARESMQVCSPTLRGNSMSTDVTLTTSNRGEESKGEIFVTSDDEKSI